VKETGVSGTTYKITRGDKLTYKVASSIRSEVGLYKTEDDYGDSYYYRGDVSNNNVMFGGYYWKIIRTNGDNSIRLIYNGKTIDASGVSASINNERYTYSVAYPDNNSLVGARSVDPTYVGYMYGKNFTRQTSAQFSYSQSVASLNKFYFADGFEFDEVNEEFKLKSVKLEPIAKTFNEMDSVDELTGKKLYELYPYTCRLTSFDAPCEVIIQMNGLKDSSHAYIQFISYSSTNKEGTRTNEYSSNVKTVIEEWYEINFINKYNENNVLLTNYIVDNTFCNDRSTDSSGYLLNATTSYGARTRLGDLNTDANVNATLKCGSDIRDRFSQTAVSGNEKLIYPIALINADELIFAGGKYRIKNTDFFLNNGRSFWTLTPWYYSNSLGWSTVIVVRQNGDLYAEIVKNKSDIRPVINIRADVLIESGDGTTENPFTLKLA